MPGPPEQLRAAAASPDQILVTWKKPSKPNGIITGYILHYRKSMDLSTSQHEFPLSSNTSSHMLRGLEVGKEYEVWMVAQTKIGKGMRTGLVRTRTMTKSRFDSCKTSFNPILIVMLLFQMYGCFEYKSSKYSQLNLLFIHATT